MTDKELRELVASLAVKSDRIDAQMAASQARIELAQAKTDAQMAKTDEKIKQVFELYNIASDKTDAKIKQAFELYNIASDKTDAKLARLSELYGGVSSNQGSVAEEFFLNTLTAHPEVGGIAFDRVTPNVMPATKTKQAEFDIVMVNGNSVAVVEVKYKVHPSDIDKATKNLKRYRQFYPEHKNYKLYGGIAGFSVPADAAKAAKEQGLFVLKRVGQVLKTDAKDMRPFD
jgi:hypothetical protein